MEQNAFILRHVYHCLWYWAPPNSITQLRRVVTNVDIVHRHRLVETRVNAEHSLGRNRFSREFLHKTASHFRRIFSTNGEKADDGYTFFLRKLANFSSVMCFCPINLVSFSKLHPRLSFEKNRLQNYARNVEQKSIKFLKWLLAHDRTLTHAVSKWSILFFKNFRIGRTVFAK